VGFSVEVFKPGKIILEKIVEDDEELEFVVVLSNN